MPAPLPTMISALSALGLARGSGVLLMVLVVPLMTVPISAASTVAPPLNVVPYGVNVLNAAGTAVAVPKLYAAWKGVGVPGTVPLGLRKTLTWLPLYDMAVMMSFWPSALTSPTATSTPPVKVAG